MGVEQVQLVHSFSLQIEMAKKVGKLKPTKGNEEDTTVVINNSSLIDTNNSTTTKSLVNSNSTNIIIKETTNPTNSHASVNNGSLSSSTKTSMSNLSIKDKSTIKENLCKEEIVEGFAFLTFLNYSDLEVSF